MPWVVEQDVEVDWTVGGEAEPLDSIAGLVKRKHLSIEAEWFVIPEQRCSGTSLLRLRIWNAATQ